MSYIIITRYFFYIIFIVFITKTVYEHCSAHFKRYTKYAMSSKQSKRTIPINTKKKKNVLKDGIKRFNHRLYNVCFDNTAARRDTAGLERFFL